MAGTYHGIVVKAEDGHHPRGDTLDRALHQFSTYLDQRQSVGKGNRPGGDQCNDLAKAVSSSDDRLRATASHPSAPQRDARGEHRRLRIDGLIEIGVRPLAHHLPEVEAENSAGLVKGLAHLGQVGEGIHHAH